LVNPAGQQGSSVGSASDMLFVSSAACGIDFSLGQCVLRHYQILGIFLKLFLWFHLKNADVPAVNSLLSIWPSESSWMVTRIFI
jgi:hypothetical protein